MNASYTGHGIIQFVCIGSLDLIPPHHLDVKVEYYMELTAAAYASTRPLQLCPCLRHIHHPKTFGCPSS